MKAKIIDETAIESKKKQARSTILCVDDEKMMLRILSEQLNNWFGQNYRIEQALSGEEALEIIDRLIKDEESISIVITDYMMPVMKGDELLIEIHKRDTRIRSIMLTGYTSVSGIVNVINQAGLYRFITKPWDSKDLMLTIMEAIKSYEQEKKTRDLAKGFESLYRKCEESTQHAVDALLSAIQAVDPALASHSMRVGQYAIWLAKKLNLENSILKNIRYASLLHGIGTLGGTVGEDEEYDVLMKQLSEAMKIINHLGDAALILKGVQYQFEKYDGSGIYKKKAEQIPEEARIVAIVHYYDLIKTDEANKNISVDQIVHLLEKRKGTHFDPLYTDEFIKILQSVRLN